jgi:outer membrane protein TolC
MNTLEMLKETIALAQEEVALAKRLEEAEERRFTTGLSDLFRLTQRETSRIEVEKKLLDYMMQESILKLELKVAVADSLFE